MSRAECRYCGQSIGYVKVYGRRKAVSLTPIPYSDQRRGYAFCRYKGWLPARDGWPEPLEMLPAHPCARIEQAVQSDELSLSSHLESYGLTPMSTSTSTSTRRTA